jgi:hypothetical protein
MSTITPPPDHSVTIATAACALLTLLIAIYLGWGLQ